MMDKRKENRKSKKNIKVESSDENMQQDAKGQASEKYDHEMEYSSKQGNGQENYSENIEDLEKAGDVREEKQENQSNPNPSGKESGGAEELEQESEQESGKKAKGSKKGKKAESANSQGEGDEMLSEEEKKEGSSEEAGETGQAENEEEKAGEGMSKEAQLEAKVEELKDKYLRLSAEFDNYRKRTLKEKSELIKSAGEDILAGFLPVMDDMERAYANVDNAKDIESLKQGVSLIMTKMKDYLSQKGVKEIEALNQEFNTDEHEAVSKIPIPEEDKKGKVIDVVEKGYYLNDKILRFSKVVVGE